MLGVLSVTVQNYSPRSTKCPGFVMSACRHFSCFTPDVGSLGSQKAGRVSELIWTTRESNPCHGSTELTEGMNKIETLDFRDWISGRAVRTEVSTL